MIRGMELDDVSNFVSCCVAPIGDVFSGVVSWCVVAPRGESVKDGVSCDIGLTEGIT